MAPYRQKLYQHKTIPVRRRCTDPAPEAFIFPNARNGVVRNGFIRTDNYRTRVLKPLAKKLGLAKLSFKVLRRTKVRARKKSS